MSIPQQPWFDEIVRRLPDLPPDPARRWLVCAAAAALALVLLRRLGTVLLLPFPRRERARQAIQRHLGIVAAALIGGSMSAPQPWLHEITRRLPAMPSDPVQRWLVLAAAALVGLTLVQTIVQVLKLPLGRRQRPGAASGPAAGASAAKLTYRTRNGRFVIPFTFALLRNQWRVYIDRELPYADFGRDESAHATHRLSDGRHYVCWSQPIRTLEQAQAVARAWAEASAQYLANGQRF